MFLEKTTKRLKSFALVDYLIRLVLFNFKTRYRRRLIQSGHRLVAFLSVETKNREGMREANIVGLREAVYSYPTFHVLGTRESIPLTPTMEGREEDAYFAPV